jgi:hypothetical protein
LDEPERRRRARRFARIPGLFAIVLVPGGLLLANTSGTPAFIGQVLAGYGIGFGVAAVFLACGFDPRKRSRR